MLRREFREIIQSNGADDLKTLRTNFVDSVIGGVPPRIIEIDDIDRRNPNRVQRRVIVDQVTVKVAKIISELQRLGRGKNVARHRGG